MNECINRLWKSSIAHNECKIGTSGLSSLPSLRHALQICYACMQVHDRFDTWSAACMVKSPFSSLFGHYYTGQGPQATHKFWAHVSNCMHNMVHVCMKSAPAKKNTHCPNEDCNQKATRDIKAAGCALCTICSIGSQRPSFWTRYLLQETFACVKMLMHGWKILGACMHPWEAM